MKKELKISLSVIGSCFVLISGYLYVGRMDYMDMQKEILLIAEHVKAHNKFGF